MWSHAPVPREGLLFALWKTDWYVVPRCSSCDASIGSYPSHCPVESCKAPVPRGVPTCPRCKAAFRWSDPQIPLCPTCGAGPEHAVLWVGRWVWWLGYWTEWVPEARLPAALRPAPDPAKVKADAEVDQALRKSGERSAALATPPG